VGVHPADKLLHLGHDFRADPVAGEKKEIHCGHGCCSPEFRFVMAGHDGEGLGADCLKRSAGLGKAFQPPLSQRHTIRASFACRDILQRTLGVP
jgi:hypothetical protein